MAQAVRQVGSHGRHDASGPDDPQAVARNQDEYRILVVAEKYQTGFDQPLLCAMYVSAGAGAGAGHTKMQQVALTNDEEPFGQVADDRLYDIVAENAERNTEFIKLYFDNAEFHKATKEAARKRAYRIINAPARDEALARLRAEMIRERVASLALLPHDRHISGC